MSASALQALKRDYIKYLSYQTVSFPLGSGAGHLYTRFGKKTFDLINDLTISNYSLTDSQRLETFISLTSLEQAHLIQYLRNAQLNKAEVLGDFEYNGRQTANGKLDDNRTCTGGHNCTSWISTAPIGESNKTLMQILKMPNTQRSNYGTNPGWWTAYLNIKSKSDKIPFAVFMDSFNSLEQMKTNLQDGKNTLNWDFDVH